MNDLERHSRAARLLWTDFAAQIRVGLQVDVGAILAASAISLRIGKVALG